MGKTSEETRTSGVYTWEEVAELEERIELAQDEVLEQLEAAGLIGMLGEKRREEVAQDIGDVIERHFATKEFPGTETAINGEGA